jgi:hypothetical protein
VSRRTRELEQLAIGPEVSVRVQGRAGRTIRVVYRALDAESYRVYRKLSEGLDGESGDTAAGVRYLAASCFLRVEGVRLAAALEAYGGRVRRWFLDSAAGYRLAEGTIPQYLSAEIPTSDELERLESAALAAILAREGKDPFDLSEHAKDCPRGIWEDRSEGQLLDLGELQRRLCEACLFAHKVARDTIADAGDARYQGIVERASALGVHLKTFRFAARTLSAREWLYLRTVRGAVEARHQQLIVRQQSDARAAAAKGR